MLKITIFHQEIPGFLKDPVAPGPEDTAWWAAFISLESANSGCSPQRLFEPDKWVDYGGFVNLFFPQTWRFANWICAQGLHQWDL